MGKTTVCQAVAELARRRGYRPGGVITPALYACPEPVGVRMQVRKVEGLVLSKACWELGIGNLGIVNWDLGFDKVGFEAVDVGSGERWPLARTDAELGGPQVGPYSFDPAALASALRVLRRAATLRQAQDTAAGCDLLMVDEIGPLELERGEGFAPILDLLPVEGPTHTLIVVRPALLDQLLLRLRETVRLGSPEPSFATLWQVWKPALLIKVFSVTEGNRNKLPLRIVKELWGDG